ncbi:MAG: hypothetical protein IPP71_03725 [Bacteroidetes bacterium]|nr:hypothetical protein [Bacteroidota bacterium]
MSTNFVWTVYEDKSGNIWFATAGGGVDVYDGNKFVNYTRKNGLPDDYVQTILEDKDGNLWFGTASGLSRFEIHMPETGKAGFIKYQKTTSGC